jgi:two-component system sensor histidine kinase QseC
MSLRGRLLLGSTVGVAAVLVLAGIGLSALVESSLVDEFDSQLVAKANLLSSTIEQTGDTLALDFVELDMPELASAEKGAFLELWCAGESLYRSPSLGETSLEVAPDPPNPRWMDLPAGMHGRAFALEFRPRQETEVPGVGPAALKLVLAEDARAIDRALVVLRGLLGTVGLVTLGVSALVLIWVVRRSLAPLRTAAERISTIDEDDLSTRLQPEGVPPELLPIVDRVNDLLARLESAFVRERSFSNDVAHELRTPLAALRTTLEVTAARKRTDEEYLEALRRSTAIVGELQGMTERLLELAHLDAFRSPVTSSCDLSELAIEIWEPFASRAAARGLRVDLHLQDDLELLADREILALILRNLYDNAVTYTDEGGAIRIAARHSGDHTCVLTVSNSGSRLTQDEASAATQRFWRGDPSRARTGSHCGLGLALVEKATSAIQGRLELRSRAGGEFAAEIGFVATRAGR